MSDKNLKENYTLILQFKLQQPKVQLQQPRKFFNHCIFISELSVF